MEKSSKSLLGRIQMSGLICPEGLARQAIGRPCKYSGAGTPWLQLRKDQKLRLDLHQCAGPEPGCPTIAAHRPHDRPRREILSHVRSPEMAHCC
jgi:hypothetical protein